MANRAKGQHIELIEDIQSFARERVRGEDIELVLGIRHRLLRRRLD